MILLHWGKNMWTIGGLTFSPESWLFQNICLKILTVFITKVNFSNMALSCINFSCLPNPPLQLYLLHSSSHSAFVFSSVLPNPFSDSVCSFFSLLLSPLDLPALELSSDPVLHAHLPHRNVLFAHKHNNRTDKSVSVQGQLLWPSESRCTEGDRNHLLIWTQEVYSIRHTVTVFWGLFCCLLLNNVGSFSVRLNWAAVFQ